MSEPRSGHSAARNLYERLAERAPADAPPGATLITGAKETIDWDQEDDPTLFLDERCRRRR